MISSIFHISGYSLAHLRHFYVVSLLFITRQRRLCKNGRFQLKLTNSHKEFFLGVIIEIHDFAGVISTSSKVPWLGAVVQLVEYRTSN